MAMVFLIGGTGNQLFQFTRAAPGDHFSTVFLAPRVRQWLGWTDHEQVLRFPPAPRWQQALGLALLAGDLLLAKLAQRSLFTLFDLRSLKARPLLRTMVRLGYFQDAPEQRAASELTGQFEGGGETPLVALHVRGGDIRAIESKGEARYGALSPAYIATALERAGFPRAIDVFTDDPGYARMLCERAAPPGVTFTYDSCGLAEMLRRCIGAGHFIACNSTLSWWITCLRGAGRPSIVPQPFTRSLGIEPPPYAERVDAGY